MLKPNTKHNAEGLNPVEHVHLFKHCRCIQIIDGEDIYLLRVTRNHTLILTK
jgi:hemin uptake protein HemP